MGRHAWGLWAAIGVVLTGCSAEDDNPGPTGPLVPAQTGVNGGTGGAPSAFAGTGGSGTPVGAAGTGMLGVAGAAGSAAGAGGDPLGMAGAAGASMAGMGGAAGSGPPSTDGVDPSAITLTTIGANETNGLDWPRVMGATGYRIYWSMTAGVTPSTGQVIEVSEPGYVHRGVTNGSAYHYVVASVLATGEGPASAEQSATPGGEWVLEQLGAGDFDDIATGQRVPQIPLSQRMHILLIAEGYLESELSIFHDHAQHDLVNPQNDVDRWLEEVFGIDPYSGLKEAFVVWFMARPSSAHIGEGTTAFGDDASMASAPLFAALDATGSDAFPFPLTTTTKNFVASFLLFDPARGRAGVSGHAESCRNPSDQQQRINCAFGVGHAHEYTHAFANVRDEYMENDNSLPQASETSNTYPTNTCSELPWAHLLAGAGIHDTPDLVGAFGRPERGYHSELLCLMNGTHDNGQYWCAPSDERYTTLTLRPDRLCNYCRELTAYSVLRRTGVLPEMGGFETWKSDYRMAFFEGFGFAVPEGSLPQVVECNRGQAGMPVYEACMP